MSARDAIAASAAPARARRDRKPTGQLITNRSKSTGKVTSYGCRFRLNGKRHYVSLDASTDAEAEAAMTYLMADVVRGLWIPPDDRPKEEEQEPVPTFHAFASDWFVQWRTAAGLDEEGRHKIGKRKGEVSRTWVDLTWRLNKHLFPFFARKRLDEIDARIIDGFKTAKLQEGRLSPGSVNKVLSTLGAILELAVDYELIQRNPARGRLLKVKQERRSYLDRPEQITALLDAAAGLDEQGKAEPWRRAFIALLVFSGCRIGEAVRLRWRHVDLATGRLHVPGTKTDAADRTVQLLPALRDELLMYAADRPDRHRDDYVFATMKRGGRGGTRLDPDNVRDRVLSRAIQDANAAQAEAGRDPLPEGITPHALRRTFASILVALGRDPAFVMRQMGHTTPHFTLRVYAGAMDWSDGERGALRALVGDDSAGRLPSEDRAKLTA